MHNRHPRSRLPSQATAIFGNAADNGRLILSRTEIRLHSYSEITIIHRIKKKKIFEFCNYYYINLLTNYINRDIV